MKLFEQIARTCQEVNKVYCESHNDFSQQSWDDAPEWQKKGVLNGVEFHWNNSDATPEDSHINWLAEKEEAGWVYGEIKNSEEKTHPCFLPYNELPAAQKFKDSLFIAVVRSFEHLKKGN